MKAEEDIKCENNIHVIILQHKASLDSTVCVHHLSKWIIWTRSNPAQPVLHYSHMVNG